MIVKHWQLENSKAFVVDIPIYHAQIFFFFGDNKEKLLFCAEEVMHERGFKAFCAVIDSMNVGDKIAYTIKKYGKYNAPVVWMPCVTKSYDDEAALAHEIFHAAVALLGSKGLFLNDSSEEAYAYLIDYITLHAYMGLAGKGFSDEPKKAKKSRKAKNEGTQHTLQ